MGDRLSFAYRIARQHAMNHLPRLYRGNIEANVLAEADVGIAVLTIDRERKDATFANSFNPSNQRIVSRAESPKVSLGSEVCELAIQAGNAVVRRQASRQALQ